MPGYIAKALQRFQHPAPNRLQHAPHAWIPPQYGTKTQFTNPIDATPPMDIPQTKRLQQIIGVLLYYARALNLTMLVALGSLAAAQTEGTQATMEACMQLLNYAATHPASEWAIMLDGTCHVRNSYSEMYDSYIDMYISDIQSCNHIFII